MIGATYDHTGDRLTRTSTIGVIPAASATYDANDRQTGISYDNNGNTTVASGVTYGYDFLNRLTSATGGIALTYGGDGNRVQETVGSTTTSYLVDDNNPTSYPQVVEELVGGVVQRTYTYGHALISQNQASGVSFYGMDAAHNVRFLTNTSGTITDQYTYDAFGNLITSTGTTPNSYRFAGEHLDSNLGLYYLRARYYNAGTGRFWNRDSAEINPDDPRELNRYVYTADNPANAVDPTGLLFEENAGLNQNSAEESEGAAATGSSETIANSRLLADELRPEAHQLWKATVRRIEGEPHVVVGKAQYSIDGETRTIIGANDFFSQGEANKSAEGILDLWRYSKQEGADFIGGGLNPTGPGKALHFEQLLRDEISLRNLPKGTRVVAAVSWYICENICQKMGTMLDNHTLLIELANDVKIIIAGK